MNHDEMIEMTERTIACAQVTIEDSIHEIADSFASLPFELTDEEQKSVNEAIELLYRASSELSDLL